MLVDRFSSSSSTAATRSSRRAWSRRGRPIHFRRSLPPKERSRVQAASGGDSSEALPDSLAEAMKTHVRNIVRREKGNIARSAARLDVDRNTVRRWLAKE